MQSIINGTILLLLSGIILYLYTRDAVWMRTINFPYKENTKYILSKNLFFLILTISTSILYLNPFSLEKYGIWALTIILLLLSGQVKIKIESITASYLFFLLWVCFSFSYTTASPTSAFMVLIKYILPLLFLWLGYSSIQNKYSFLILIRSVIFIAAIYIIWVGGFGAVFLPSLYYSPIGNEIFLTYAGFADYLTSLFPIPFILFYLTKKKVYIFIALWLVLSTLLEGVRTGLGGMALAAGFVSYGIFKQRSFPFIAVVAGLFIAVVLFVPSIRNKMFFEQTEEETEQIGNIFQEGRINTENIRDNGRRAVWDITLNKLYNGKKLTGSGVGCANEFIKDRGIREHTVALIHNDYVQILSDFGLIGLSLFIFFVIMVLLSTIKVINGDAFWVRMAASLSLGSFAGVLFSMGFDNVVGHSMTSFVNPFIFTGCYLKIKELNEQGALDI